MIDQAHESIFTQYVHHLSSPEKKLAVSPLENHPQIPLLLDILNRKEQHHLMLLDAVSEKINFAIMENLAQHLTKYTVVYFDALRLILSGETPENMQQYFHTLSNQRIIFVINQVEPVFTEKLIKLILAHKQWRIIVFTQSVRFPLENYLTGLFTTLKLIEPSATELFSVLKTYKPSLEDFHRVLIEEEAFAYAFSIASRYLCGKSNLDKAFALLDSAAARANIFGRKLTNDIIAEAASNWTRIPLTHLHNKFKITEFARAIQERIHGQEAAIHFIGSILLQLYNKLLTKSEPMGSFLFVGPAGVGKKEAAYAIAEYLFGHKNALLHINFDNLNNNLFTDIQRTPYAIVLLENVNQTSVLSLDLFKDIFTQGYAVDKEGNKYDFRQAIFIMTTTLSAEHIIDLTQSQAAQVTAHATNLMQLVLNELPPVPATKTHSHLVTQELAEEIMPILATFFPTGLLQNSYVVPFIPLDLVTMEKIIRIKLKSFAQHINANFGIELSYTPEVIKFLIHKTTKSIDKLLEQHLYSCVMHEISAHLDDKNKPKQLIVQLNDSGQVLRCE